MIQDDEWIPTKVTPPVATPESNEEEWVPTKMAAPASMPTPSATPTKAAPQEDEWVPTKMETTKPEFHGVPSLRTVEMGEGHKKLVLPPKPNRYDTFYPDVTRQERVGRSSLFKTVTEEGDPVNLQKEQIVNVEPPNYKPDPGYEALTDTAREWMASAQWPLQFFEKGRNLLEKETGLTPQEVEDIPWWQQAAYSAPTDIGVAKGLSAAAKPVASAIGATRPGRFAAEVMERTMPTFTRSSRVARVASDTGDWVDKAVSKIFDDLHEVERVKNRLSYVPKDITKDPVAHYRLARSIGGRLEADAEDLKRILKPVSGDLEDFFAYGQSRRAATVQGAKDASSGTIGREIMGGKTAAEHGAIAQALEAKPGFKETFDKVVQFNNDSFDQLVKSGFISEEKANMMKQADYFQPFYRELPDSAKAAKGAGVGIVPKGIKGSELAVQDPIEAIIKRHTAFTRAAIDNDNAKVLVDMLSSSPDGQLFAKRVTRPQKIPFKLGEIDDELAKLGVKNLSGDEVASIWRNMGKVGAGEIPVFRDGKMEVWKFTKTGEELFNAIRPERIPSGVVKILSAPTRLLRLGATSLNPNFLGFNIIRDLFGRAMQTSTKGGAVQLLGDTVESFKNVMQGRFGQNELYDMWRKDLGSMGGMIGADRKSMQKVVSQIKGDTLYNLKHPFETLQRISEVFEETGRLAEYKRQLAQHGTSKASRMRAALASRDITLDFQRHGSMGKQWNQIAAFFNAGVQDLSKVKRTLEHQPAETLMRGTTYITAPTVLLWNLNKDNPHYQNMNGVMKNLFWNIPVGDPSSTDKFIRVPKPYLWGWMFGTVPEELLNATFKKDPKAVGRMMEGLGMTAVPNLIPQMMQPALLWWANYDTFTKHPVESQGDLRKIPMLRANEGTSETAKAVGYATRNLPSGLQVSPKKMDATIRTFLGGAGRTATNLIDLAGGYAKEKGLIEAPVFQDKHDVLPKTPVIGAFIREKQGWVDHDAIDEFYANLDRANQSNSSFKKLAERRNIEAAPEGIGKWSGFAKSLNRMKRGIDEINDAADDIHASRHFTDEEKDRKIKKLYERMNTMVRKMNTKVSERTEE